MCRSCKNKTELTNQRSVQFSSHRDMTMPTHWVELYKPCHERALEIVLHNSVSVSVTTEKLQ